MGLKLRACLPSVAATDADAGGDKGRVTRHDGGRYFAGLRWRFVFHCEGYIPRIVFELVWLVLAFVIVVAAVEEFAATGPVHARELRCWHAARALVLGTCPACVR